MSHTNPAQRNRTYWGSDTADLLIRWLNQTAGTARNRRIMELVGQITDYIRITDQAAGSAPSPSRKSDKALLMWEGKRMPEGEFLAVRNKEIEEAANAINLALRRYSLRPRLAGRYADRSLFAWSPPSKDWMTSGDKLPIEGVFPKAYVVFTEGHAVKQITELCHEGLIDRLRKCPCGNWFYAKFSHSKFCSPTCQQKIYRSSPEWKKHRQEWAKRNRALHKQRVFPSIK
jgi:hypothetical protein